MLLIKTWKICSLLYLLFHLAACVQLCVVFWLGGPVLKLLAVSEELQTSYVPQKSVASIRGYTCIPWLILLL